MNDPREILYDTRWQYLRLQLKPGWGDPVSAHGNLARLQAYLDLADSPQELFLRLHRVTNLLALLPEARKSLLEDPVALEIALFRKAIMPLFESLEPQYPLASLPNWDEEEQYRMLKRLREVDPQGFQRLLADVSGRYAKLPKDERGPMVRYLSLLRKVSNELLT